MNRLAKAVLLVGSLAVAMPFVLAGALATVLDPHHYCETGFSRLVDCTYHWSSRTIGQSNPIFTTPSTTTGTTASGSRDTFQPTYVDVTSWAIAYCPSNSIARRLLCAAASDAAPAEAAEDDHVTGLPRPKPWLLTTAENSPFIKAVHIETPLALAAALRFYRLALSKRGWTETDGAVVEPGGAVIAFTTADGPAMLRLTRQDGRTIADLSLRKPALTNAGILPMPGQMRLLLGNATDEEAVITLNEQTIQLAARAGHELTEAPGTGRKSPGSAEIDLPPGRYKIALATASGASQNREFEAVAGETWGLLAGPAGIPIPVHLY
jgi:hypothetical protein